MIIKIEMFGCQCDNCGESWVDEDNGFAAFTDECSMENVLSEDDEWYTDHATKTTDTKHYCKKCWSFDDEDNLVLRKIETIKK